MTAKDVDVLLVGGGVMSATLGMLLKQLDPNMTITLVERLDHVAHESTDGWNNAGTGHAGYCELNYTPQADDGNITINRALSINANFEVTLQFWSYLVEQQILPAPGKFINPTAHQSFVWGEKDVAFLRKRHELLSAHHLFADMQYSESREQLAEWMPLVMRDRAAEGPVAATRVDHGSDVDFGSLTRSMIKHLVTQDGFDLCLSHSVKSLRKSKRGHWRVAVKDEQSGEDKQFNARFVFLGAGGGSLPLLQKSHIDESQGYGGFPVSGQWLVCKKPEIVQQHHSKVYGKAPVGAPPMSVPHLDTRIINGQPALLFGPFAGFTTKFLKKGSVFDLFSSVRPYNVAPMMAVGRDNMDLTKYLIAESFQSHKDRVASLRNFFPDAKEEDWTLQNAGMRVQIIKKDAEGHGKLEFGTEIVAAKDGTLAALLGASPGASTAVQAMIDVLHRCFKERMSSPQWQTRMKELVPSYGQSLIDDAALLKTVRDRTLSTLNLRGD
ncbi:malate dehydrogenase (quinone) [Pseudomonas sp. G11-1]|jgi:malate dehydrogenase (quinone)|uniref:Probable malate:quinone oxidoreductase n=1 Tax=Halopseudomonas bauzanensis TaxID=653930 RepID=A0A031MFX2_9GAMM|nr:malate dehydrogenase (quinone) [Halopseudomonas bauzanensis]MCO5786584.1 malate dehydrogenase (quinone) [Pseudomonas sp. G11-1]MCO5789810.1 malate dehydrogenase (quinone) [Pseudomonas sp. G11-2]EZQ18659.1 malate:quinone oxidoreductase [Halopseudomonas bauzanensis]TKA92270.1 malate dehydrogenase (quinone) [Halopseudomonas bauzanensis]SES23721.1 malate dehydrogenase (quinone) [Halopseudomonas bauzanensis]